MEFLAQFVDNDGNPTGPQISLPVSTSTLSMTEIVNKFLGNEEPTPFSFYVNEEQIVGALESIASTVSTEDVVKIVYRPESSFGVRPVSFCSATLPGHSAIILCIAFSNTGLDLATGGGDGSVIFWDVSIQSMRQKLPIKDNVWIQCIKWHQDGNVLAVAGTDGVIRIIHRNTKDTNFSLRNEIKVSNSPIFAIEWEPLHLQDPNQHPRIAATTKKGEVCIFCSKTGRKSVTMNGHQKDVMGLAWGASGTLFTCSHDKTVKAWNNENGAEIGVYSARSGAWRTLAISTAFVLRTGGYELGKVLDGCSNAREAAVKRLEEHQKVSPVEMIAVGGQDHTISLLKFDAAKRSFTEVQRITGHVNKINHICFSPNGYWLSSASDDKTVKLFDGRTGKFICTLGKGKGRFTGSHVGAVYQLAWSPDSRKLISASADTTLKIWSITTQKLIHDLPGHEDVVYAVDWSPLGAPAASGGKDKQVKLWR